MTNFPPLHDRTLAAYNNKKYRFWYWYPGPGMTWYWIVSKCCGMAHPSLLHTFLFLFSCLSPPHTLLARIENATVVDSLLCRGAIDGTLPHSAARRLQSMRPPHSLYMCVCLFATGAWRGVADGHGGGDDDDGDDDAMAVVLPTCFLA